MQQYDSDMSGLVCGSAICDHAAWMQMIRGVCVCFSTRGPTWGLQQTSSAKQWLKNIVFILLKNILFPKFLELQSES